MAWLQVRDYIHVVDLAEGHIAALRKLFESSIGLHNLLLSHVIPGARDISTHYFMGKFFHAPLAICVQWFPKTSLR